MEADSSVHKSSMSSSPKHHMFTKDNLNKGLSNRDDEVSSSTEDLTEIENVQTSRPIQIVTVNPETREFELDVESLSKILLNERLRDKPVSVLSIAGDFRKGKSFILNYFLRFLQHDGENDWLDERNNPLTGFSWRGGSERDTTGILMWSEPFIMKKSDGQEVVVLLMDTQGAFDSEYTVRDSATIFALSTMTSSIQIFNLLHNLQEDNLQVLEIFTEYGRLALEATEEKPFQKLLFLIRDWSYPYEHPYGLNGGLQLLDKKLKVKDTQPTQLQRVRRHIRSCFYDISCYLLPHPGTKVATSPKFDGRLSDIEADFVNELKILVPLILDSDNIVVKEISGQKVTCRHLLEYFKAYINIFKGETMPEPKSMLEATAEANNLAAVALAKENYMSAMEELCGGSKPFLNPNILQLKHDEFRSEALQSFEKARKMGGKEFSESYLQKLEEEIIIAYEHYSAQNKSKNMFSVLGAPVVLLVWCVITFIISRTFELIGITFLSNMFFFFGTFSLLLTITYMFFRYGGTYPEFVQGIDAMSENVWNMTLDFSYKMMEDAVKNRVSLNTGIPMTPNSTSPQLITNSRLSQFSTSR